MTTSRILTTLALASGTTLVASACAGGVSGGSQAGGGDGFAFGADQSEVSALIEDLEPVTLSYQPSAGSPNSVVAITAHALKEEVERRSDGKITIEIAWGQSIAGYSDIVDALADGRVDLSAHLPIYEPSDFRVYDAFATSLSSQPISPVMGESVHLAVASELGANSDALYEEFEAQGVTPIAPLISAGAYYGMCSSKATTLDEWNGKQVRVASTAHHKVAEAIGAVPVSLEWVETYEALQRGTVDCTLGQLHSSAEGGVLEVAPHIAYTSDDNALSSRVVAAELAGQSFQNLPLAYQQIIFDSMWVNRMAGQLNSIIDGKKLAVEQAKGAGGGAVPLADDVEKRIAEANADLTEGVRSGGLIDSETLDSIPELTEKWQARAAEVGLEDAGTIEDLDEWWEPGEVDFTEFASAVYEESGIAHRPGS